LEEYAEILFVGKPASDELVHEMQSVNHHRVRTVHEQEVRNAIKDACRQLASFHFNPLGQGCCHLAVLKNRLDVGLLDFLF
jgi:hypothetical protein